MEPLTIISLWIGFIGLVIGAIYFGKDAVSANGEDWEEFHIVHFTITVVAALGKRLGKEYRL